METDEHIRNKDHNLKVIKNILIIMAIPLVFYLLKLLSFIFIPLFGGLFLTILFTPHMRWFAKKKLPKLVALLGVVAIIGGFFFLTAEMIKLSSHEIMNADMEALKSKAETKLMDIAAPIEDFFGMDRKAANENIHNMFSGNNNNLMSSFGSSLNIAQKFVTQVLMMFFFMILLLAGSVDMQKLMNSTVVKRKSSSIKTMLKIEKSIVKFIWVKFLLSAFTGLGFGLACWGFDVSFPFFWGLFAFAINFVQMVGSVIATVVCGLFGIAEIDSTGTLLAFWLVLTGTQVLFGGILEPIFMGKTFSINTVTVLVMLMLWGFIWGVPGLIMSIPITVLIKTILEQNERTAGIAKVMS